MIPKLAIICAALVLLLVCVATYLLVAFIPGGVTGGSVALGLLSAGALGAGLVGYLVSRLPDSRRLRACIGIALVLLVALPAASMAYPGRISYARFGFTVYGAVPVPFLDVTVDRHGLLWFRQKTHEVTVEEVAALIDSEVEAVVIGTGWERMVRVGRDVRALAGGAVEVLPTPEAFARFNQLRREGRCVVLLAHSTC